MSLQVGVEMKVLVCRTRFLDAWGAGAVAPSRFVAGRDQDAVPGVAGQIGEHTDR